MIALLTIMAGAAQAASAASIAGTITDAEGNPITTQNICIDAYGVDGDGDYGSATTDASGDYEITELSEGSYEVYVSDCYDSGRDDISGYYEVNGSVADVELTADEVKTGIDVQLAAGTSISGHVYGGTEDSTPLADACVYVYEATSSYQDQVGYAYTGSDGAYTVDGLRSGVGYKLEFVPCSSGSSYSDEYYDEKGGLAEADTVTPTTANPSTGIDGHLPAGASISGTVSDAEGNPITTQDVCVSAQSYGGYGYSYATTNASGEYTITGLAAGSYYVEFYDCATSARNDVSQYYGGVPSADESTLVVLSTGGTKTGIDAQLAPGTSISGHAYAGSGTGSPIGEQCVYVQARSPSGSDSYYYDYYARTDSSGSYTISRVAPIGAGYTIEFYDCSYPARYVSQYFGGSYKSSTASTVTPTVESPAEGIDAHMEVGGTISGTVTDSKGNAIGSGVCAQAELVGSEYDDYYDESSDELTSTGEYTIGALPTGSYDVYFYDCGTRNDVNQELPNTVTVTVGEPTDGIDATMQPATSISGHVYGGEGTATPLQGICVQLYNSDGSPAGYDSGFTDTGAGGAYKLEHLEPGGDYVVEFNTCSSYESNGYATQYYDGVSELSQADVLTPTLAAPSTEVDAHLPSGAPITTITGGPAADAATSDTDARFSFTANVAGSTFACALDGGAYEPCASPYDTGTLTPGKHTFTVRASANGQTETSPRYVTWTVDPSSPTSTSQGEVTSGGTFSSDPGGETSASTPVIVAVTPPSSSQVTLTTEPTTTPSGNGYTIFGEQVDIAAAEPDGAGAIAGSESEPIKLVFTIDASQIPAGTETSAVTVTRNGQPAAPCTTPGTANPDPCVQSRSTNAAGDLEIVVLTTHCSTWNFATLSTPTSEQTSGHNGGTGPGTGSSSSTNSGSPTATSTEASGGVLGARSVSGNLSLVGSLVAVGSRGQAAVKLTCVSTVTCSGKLILTVKTKIHAKGKKAKTRTTTIGTTTFSIPAGATKAVKLTLTAVGRSLLSADHGALVASLAIVKTSPGPSLTQSKDIRLTQQRARRASKKG